MVPPSGCSPKKNLEPFVQDDDEVSISGMNSGLVRRLSGKLETSILSPLNRALSSTVI